MGLYIHRKCAVCDCVQYMYACCIRECHHVYLSSVTQCHSCAVDYGMSQIDMYVQGHVECLHMTEYASVPYPCIYIYIYILHICACVPSQLIPP